MLVSDLPKGSCKVIYSSEKAKVSELIRKEKKSYAEIAEIYGKNNSPWNCGKEEKEICASFAVVL